MGRAMDLQRRHSFTKNAKSFGSLHPFPNVVRNGIPPLLLFFPTLERHFQLPRCFQPFATVPFRIGRARLTSSFNGLIDKLIDPLFRISGLFMLRLPLGRVLGPYLVISMTTCENLGNLPLWGFISVLFAEAHQLPVNPFIAIADDAEKMVQRRCLITLLSRSARKPLP